MQLTPAKWLRLLLFVVLAGFIIGSPAYTQLFNRKVTPLQRSWRMFGDIGSRTCQATYWVHTDAGEQPVDRAASLGLTSLYVAPKDKRNLEGVDAVKAEGARICEVLKADDVRVDARCGSIRGWKPVLSHDLNLCEPQAKARRPRAR